MPFQAPSALGQYHGAVHTGAPAPIGFDIGAGPYGGYPHGLSKQVSQKFQQPYQSFPFMYGANAGAHPGAFPGHPGLATGAPYPHPVPLPTSGGSYGGLGNNYGAAGVPHPAEHHGYRPNGRGHWGFAAPKY